MKDQILKATGDELSRLAGEVLVPELCNDCHAHTFHRLNLTFTCWHTEGHPIKKAIDKACSSAKRNPIPLTWPEAMKWRDWAVKEYGGIKFADALFEVYMQEEKPDVTVYTPRGFYLWLAYKAQPEHYIKAACLCKLGVKK